MESKQNAVGMVAMNARVQQPVTQKLSQLLHAARVVPLIIGCVLVSSWMTHAQTFTKRFSTASGIYGEVTFYCKPGTFGFGYVGFHRIKVTVDGVRRGGQNIHGNMMADEGISFPTECKGCYFTVRGKVCIRFQPNPPYDCGYFDQVKVHGSVQSFGAMGNSAEAHFSQAIKDKHNRLVRELGYSMWEKEGFVSSVTVSDVEGADFNNISWAADSYLESLEFDAIVSEADGLFQSEQYEAAREKYKEALRIKYDSPYAKDQIALIDEKLMEQERNEDYKRLVAEGDQLLAQGDIEDAEAKYKQAQRLKPDDLPAERGLAQIEQKREQKKQEGKKKKTSEQNSTKKEEQSKQNSNYEALKSQQEQRYENLRNYHEQKAMELEQNVQMASDLAAAQFSAYALIAMFMYQGMGSQITDNVSNLYVGNSWMLTLKGGFNVKSLPIWKNVTAEKYDGASTTYDEFTENGQTFTLGMDIGLEFWPFYGDQFGFGGYVTGSGGFLINNSELSYETGFMAMGGGKVFKIFGQVGYGGRSVNLNNWTSPYSISEGKSRYRYWKYRIGPRFTVKEVNAIAPTRLHIDIQPTFEMPNIKSITERNKNPIIYNEAIIPGIHLGFIFENQLDVYLDIYWNYTRSGTREFSLNNEESSPVGTFMQAGVIRKLDFYGNGSKNSEVRKGYKRLIKNHKWFIALPSLSTSWIIRKGETEAIYNDMPKLNIRLTRVEKSINLFKQLSLYGGVGVSMSQGAIIKQDSRYNNVRLAGSDLETDRKYILKYHQINFPTGLRFMSIPQNNFTTVWIAGGVNNHITLSNGKIFKEDENGDMIDQGNNDLSLNRHHLGWEVGAGVDFIVLQSVGMRAGFTYERSIKSIIEEQYPLKLQTISMSIGFIL